MPGLTPPPASHIVKPCGLWSRPSSPCAVGVRPNSPPQRTSVSSSSPRAFRSASRPAIGRSTSRAFCAWSLLQVAVLVPLVAVGNLHEAHAALGEPPGHQALAAEVLRLRVVEAVELARRRRFAGRCPATRGAAACMRKASSNESMRPSSARSGPVRGQVLAVHLAAAGRAPAAASRAASDRFR